MQIDCRQAGDVVVLKPRASRIDAERAEEFKSVLERAGLTTESAVLLDLSDVEFVDSSGLGAVVWAFKSLRRTGGQLEICGLRPEVQQVFKLTRMDRVFRIHEDAERARLLATGS